MKIGSKIKAKTYINWHQIGKLTTEDFIAIKWDNYDYDNSYFCNHIAKPDEVELVPIPFTLPEYLFTI